MVHVCYNVNNKIFKGLLMSIMSVAKRTDAPITFHILSMDLSHRKADWTPMTNEEMTLLNEAIKEYNPENFAEQIDCGQLYSDFFANGRNKLSIYTPYAMLRLFLDKTPLHGNPDKVIYLDTDTMCLKDIRSLWDVDISNYEFGACLDYMGKFWIDVDYCNSGVMLINLDKVKQTGLLEKARNRVATKTMFMPDQSALNDLVKDKLILPRKFNEQRQINENTVIKHFCKGIKFYPFFLKIYNVKQWEIDKVHKILKIHDFDDIYEDVEKLGV